MGMKFPPISSGSLLLPNVEEKSTLELLRMDSLGTPGVKQSMTIPTTPGPRLTAASAHILWRDDISCHSKGLISVISPSESRCQSNREFNQQYTETDARIDSSLLIRVESDKEDPVVSGCRSCLKPSFGTLLIILGLFIMALIILLVVNGPSVSSPAQNFPSAAETLLAGGQAKRRLIDFPGLGAMQNLSQATIRNQFVS